MSRLQLIQLGTALALCMTAEPAAAAARVANGSPQAASPAGMQPTALQARWIATLPPDVLARARARVPATPRGFVPGEVVVILRDVRDVSLLASGAIAAKDAGLAAVLQRHGLDRYESLGQRGGARGSHGSYLRLLSQRPDFDPVAASAELRAAGRFRAAIPNGHVRLFATLPNDPLRPEQWHIDTAGSADIHLPEAWDLARGSHDVTIAIMDLGVDFTHPDLAAAIWTNPGEIVGNATDDDGNGLADDVHGWDFGGNDSDPLPEPTFEPELGLDIGFHGTHCAGIAAAVTNNAVGVSGASWGCAVMALKVSDPVSGEISDAAVAGAFDYAGAMGADVLSMSFGGPGDPGVPEFFQALVDDATAAGVLCVAAAGNDSVAVPSYPAACAGVLSVAATDELNARAFFSNFGPTVDVGAPGSQIFSTIAQNYEVDFLSQLFYILLFNWDGVSSYMLSDGTSMACPLAAGVCALVKSQAPSLTPQALAQVVINSGDVVAYDHPIGKKVNAFRAVQTVLTRTAVEPGVGGAAGPGSGGAFAQQTRDGAVRLVAVAPNPFNPRTVVRFNAARPGAFRAEIFDLAGRRVRTLLNSSISSGSYQLVWEGDDAAGRAVASGVYQLRLGLIGGETLAAKLVLAR